MDSGAYGVQVGNKFELFLDDASDPEELEQRALEQARVAQEKKKKEEQKKKLAPPPKKEAAPKAGAQPAAQKGPPAANNNSTGFSQPAKKEGFEEGKENKPERGGFRGGFRGGRGEGRGGFRGDRGGRGRGGGGGDRGGGTGGGPKANFTNFPEGEVPPRFAQQQQVQPEGGGDQPKKFEDRFGESRGGFGRGRGPRGGFRGEFRGRGRGGGAGRPPAQEGGGNFGEWNGPPPAGGEEGQQQQGGKGFGQLIEDAAPPAKGGFGTFSVTNADDESGDVTGFKEGRGGRGYNRGRGNRGGGRGGNFGGRGRQFERHSGSDKTGVKPVEKRDGGGAYNWGDTNDELKGETEPLDTTVGSDEQAAGEKPAEGGEGKEDGGPPAQAVEPEPIVMTLDEWKKRQEPRERPQFNIRRAGEGEDDKQWKKLVPLQKEIKTSDGDEHEDEEHEDRRKHKTVDLSINFFDEAKRVGGGPGGGERGGFGRGRGRGEGRGGFGGDRGGGGGFRGDREGRGGFRGDRGEGRGGFRGDRGGGFRGDRGGFGGGGGHRGGGGGGGRGRGHAEEFSLAGESFPELSSAA